MMSAKLKIFLASIFALSLSAANDGPKSNGIRVLSKSTFGDNNKELTVEIGDHKLRKICIVGHAGEQRIYSVQILKSDEVGEVERLFSSNKPIISGSSKDGESKAISVGADCFITINNVKIIPHELFGHDYVSDEEEEFFPSEISVRI